MLKDVWHTSLIEAIDSMGSRRSTLRLPEGCSVRCDDDLTIPENVLLHLEQGAQINVASGKTLTVPRLHAGPHQIFGGEGTVRLGYRVGEVYPEWWGAVGNGHPNGGGVDDTTALHAAIATTGGVGQPSVLVLAGSYRITRPLWFGEFFTSYRFGNSQSPETFMWGDEAKHWGGEKSGFGRETLVIRGRVCNDTDGKHGVNEPSLIADFATSLPMLFFMGCTSVHLEQLTLVSKEGAHAWPSEAVFLTAGVYGFSYSRLMIKRCLRGIRLGNLRHWPEDPITFTAWENPNGYPGTTAGWMVERVRGDHLTTHDCQTSISQETAQTLQGVHDCPALSGNSNAHGLVCLYAGNLTLRNVLFSSGPGKAGVWCPDQHNTVSLTMEGGENELNSHMLLQGEYAGDVLGGGWSASLSRVIGGHVEVAGPWHVLIDNCDLLDVRGTESSNIHTNRIVHIRGGVIHGQVGSVSAGYCRRESWECNGVTFAGDFPAGLPSPFSPYFFDHGANTVKGCVLLGPSFTEAVRWCHLADYQKGRNARLFGRNIQAFASLGLPVQPADGETVTIDGKVYTFQTALTDADGHVQIGADLLTSSGNLLAAINLASGSGTKYAAATTMHPTVSAAQGPGAYAANIVVTAKAAGAAGNAIVVDTRVTDAAWVTPTLQYGADSLIQIGTEDAVTTDALVHFVTQGAVRASVTPEGNLGIAQYEGARLNLKSVCNYVYHYPAGQASVLVDGVFPADTLLVGLTWKIVAAFPAPTTTLSLGVVGNATKYAHDVSSGLSAKGRSLSNGIHYQEAGGQLLITPDVAPGASGGQILIQVWGIDLTTAD